MDTTPEFLKGQKCCENGNFGDGHDCMKKPGKPQIAMTNSCPYPPEEDAICATLIREIGKYNTWADKVEAWNALLQVRTQARCMREERDYLKGNIRCQAAAIDH